MSNQKRQTTRQRCFMPTTCTVLLFVSLISISHFSFFHQTYVGQQHLRPDLHHNDATTRVGSIITSRLRLEYRSISTLESASLRKPTLLSNEALSDNITASTTAMALPQGRSVVEQLQLERHVTRVLMGIFTLDIPEEARYRAQFRLLFGLDQRICTLAEFQVNQNYHDNTPCELIYTFVAGMNPTATTELVDDSRPMLVDRPVISKAGDFNDPDMTLLNIKENMNDGKSQTWIAYGLQMMQQYNIDYLIKSDTDSVLVLDRYFNFVHKHLPPAPYNRNILAGLPADKWWWKTTLEDQPFRSKEEYLIQKYGRAFHLYAQGQFYMLSADLAQTVVQEARRNKYKTYIEGHEDHDVAAMAFRSEEPIHFIMISLDQRFWRHGVKLNNRLRWHTVWKEELGRMAQLLNVAPGKAASEVGQ